MKEYEVYLTDARNDTVILKADSWDLDENGLCFYAKDKDGRKQPIARFNFNNIKGFMEVAE